MAGSGGQAAGRQGRTDDAGLVVGNSHRPIEGDIAGIGQAIAVGDHIANRGIIGGRTGLVEGQAAGLGNRG